MVETLPSFISKSDVLKYEKGVTVFGRRLPAEEATLVTRILGADIINRFPGTDLLILAPVDDIIDTVSKFLPDSDPIILSLRDKEKRLGNMIPCKNTDAYSIIRADANDPGLVLGLEYAEYENP